MFHCGQTKHPAAREMTTDRTLTVLWPVRPQTDYSPCCYCLVWIGEGEGSISGIKGNTTNGPFGNENEARNPILFSGIYNVILLSEN